MLIEFPAAQPWPALYQQMRQAQEGFNEMFERAGLSAGDEFPPVNLWAGRDGAILTAEIPGVEPDQLDVTVHQDTLVLRGKRDPELAGDDVVAHRRERDYGPFSRTFVLPFRVDADKVSARFDRGVLVLELPRPEADKPRQIRVARAS